MNKEQIRVAIAMDLGAKWCVSRDEESLFLTFKYQDERVCEHGPYKDVFCVFGSDIPNWPQDLNAMHDLEKSLNNPQQAYFCGFLHTHVPNDAPESYQRDYMRAKFKYIHATAFQRAEAYLRTKGLWHD